MKFLSRLLNESYSDVIRSYYSPSIFRTSHMHPNRPPPPPRPLSSFDTLALDLDDLTVKQRTVNSLGAVCLKALFFVDFRPFFLKIQ